MSIHVKPSGKYQVRWRGGGRPHAKSFDLLADAEKFQEKIRRRKQVGEASQKLQTFDKTNLGEQVYIVRGADKVKIGISTDVISRLGAFQAGSPVPLVIEWRIDCPNARKLEAALHKRYADYRSHGEWFDAQPVLSDLAELAKLGAHQFAPFDVAGEVGS